MLFPRIPLFLRVPRRSRLVTVLLAAALVACGGGSGTNLDADVSDAVFDADVSDAAKADVEIDPLCGDCDDHDSVTTDRCVHGRCEHRRCEADIDCDDGDPDTTDRCVMDPRTVTWTCGHSNRDGDCGTDADCYDGQACTADLCGTGARCRHTWIAGCEAANPLVLPHCPASAAEGGPCATDAETGLGYDCKLGEDRCDDWLRCVGNTFGTRYIRIETVRPGCDASACPAEMPVGLCVPELFCDYGGSDGPPGRIYCECVDRFNTTIEWSCFDNDPCPPTPPADGSSVDRTPVTGPAHCFYGDYSCEIDSRTWTWSCRTTVPQFCPESRPEEGEECVLDSRCPYYGREAADEPVTAYYGNCVCDGSRWSCTPNAAADCPAEQPIVDFDMCTPTTGNAECWYPIPDEEELSTRCHCDPPFETNTWLCDVTARFSR